MFSYEKLNSVLASCDFFQCNERYETKSAFMFYDFNIKAF